MSFNSTCPTTHPFLIAEKASTLEDGLDFLFNTFPAEMYDRPQIRDTFAARWYARQNRVLRLNESVNTDLYGDSFTSTSSGSTGSTVSSDNSDSYSSSSTVTGSSEDDTYSQYSGSTCSSDCSCSSSCSSYCSSESGSSRSGSSSTSKSGSATSRSSESASSDLPSRRCSRIMRSTSGSIESSVSSVSSASSASTASSESSVSSEESEDHHNRRHNKCRHHHCYKKRATNGESSKPSTTPPIDGISAMRDIYQSLMNKAWKTPTTRDILDADASTTPTSTTPATTCRSASASKTDCEATAETQRPLTDSSPCVSTKNEVTGFDVHVPILVATNDVRHAFEAYDFHTKKPLMVHGPNDLVFFSPMTHDGIVFVNANWVLEKEYDRLRKVIASKRKLKNGIQITVPYTILGNKTVPMALTIPPHFPRIFVFTDLADDVKKKKFKKSCCVASFTINGLDSLIDVLPSSILNLIGPIISGAFGQKTSSSTPTSSIYSTPPSVPSGTAADAVIASSPPATPAADQEPILESDGV